MAISGGSGVSGAVEDWKPESAGAARSATWRWYICGLLLLATVVNYMDRLTVNILSKPIQAEFQLNNQQYGNLELGFGLAFAAGSLLFGWLVDRIGVFWLYPVALIGWSAMGFLTGRSRTYEELLGLRIALGLFEAGHFPCGLKTIQLLMAPKDRALGNGLLQGGTALGAVLAPLAIFLLKTDGVGGWRPPFLVIGLGGMAWVVLWFLSIRPRHLHWDRTPSTSKAEGADPGSDSLWRAVFSGRFLALGVMVVCINLNWHFFRVWLPKLLQEARGYGEKDMYKITMLYYIAADVGGIGAGAASGWLASRGLSVYASRMWVFAGCCFLTTLTTFCAFLPAGPLLIGTLMLVASGGLGSYAAYYSMTQDLSRRHQGKISGSLATITWICTAIFQPLFGRILDRTHNYDVGLGIVGWSPMVALVVILVLWNRGRRVVPGVGDDGTVSDAPVHPAAEME